MSKYLSLILIYSTSIFCGEKNEQEKKDHANEIAYDAIDKEKDLETFRKCVYEGVEYYKQCIKHINRASSRPLNAADYRAYCHYPIGLFSPVTQRCMASLTLTARLAETIKQEKEDEVEKMGK